MTSLLKVIILPPTFVCDSTTEQKKAGTVRAQAAAHVPKGRWQLRTQQVLTQLTQPQTQELNSGQRQKSYQQVHESIVYVLF